MNITNTDILIKNEHALKMLVAELIEEYGTDYLQDFLEITTGSLSKFKQSPLSLDIPTFLQTCNKMNISIAGINDRIIDSESIHKLLKGDKDTLPRKYRGGTSSKTVTKGIIKAINRITTKDYTKEALAYVQAPQNFLDDNSSISSELNYDIIHFAANHLRISPVIMGQLVMIKNLQDGFSALFNDLSIIDAYEKFISLLPNNIEQTHRYRIIKKNFDSITISCEVPECLEYNQDIHNYMNGYGSAVIYPATKALSSIENMGQLNARTYATQFTFGKARPHLSLVQ